MQYNLYNKSLLQLRCNDLDYTIKASTCTTSKYYSYMFYADRNVRPCMILGYTLTTFPKSLIQTKRQKEQLHQIASCKRRRTLHNWWRISGQQVFYTARKQLNKIRKRGNSQSSKQQEKRTTLSFVYFSLFISKVKPNAGRQMVIRSRYKI